jgi:hypothetical protein
VLSTPVSLTFNLYAVLLGEYNIIPFGNTGTKEAL